ncbi:MAG TPA: hypothetical protein VNJ46_00085 [Gaiellaceae bacterium]|nr:hypothetical protein [Gaiellaceae bacterium]
MSLYLSCVICARKQADGLISGAAWGRVEVPHGAAVEHPAVTGRTVRACPTCCREHPDWRERILAALGLDPGFESLRA